MLITFALFNIYIVFATVKYAVIINTEMSNYENLIEKLNKLSKPAHFQMRIVLTTLNNNPPKVFWKHGSITYFHHDKSISNTLKLYLQAWTPIRDDEFLLFFPEDHVNISRKFLHEIRYNTSSITRKTVAVCWKKSLISHGQTIDGPTLISPSFWRLLGAYNDWQKKSDREKSIDSNNKVSFKESIESLMIRNCMFVGYVENSQRTFKSQNEFHEYYKNCTENKRDSFKGLSKPLKHACILDEFSKEPIPSDLKERYLHYEPQGSWLTQTHSLQVAVILSLLLDRVLILPPLVVPTNTTMTIPFETIFKIMIPPGTRIIPYFGLLKNYEITRQISLENIHMKLMKIKSTTVVDMALGTLSLHNTTVPLHSHMNDDVYLKNAFGDCGDAVLSFSHLASRTYSFFTQKDVFKITGTDDGLIYQTGLPLLVDSLNELMLKILPKETIFGIYSRGDQHLHRCGHLIKPYAEHGYAYYRSCVIDSLSILNAVKEKAKKFKIGNFNSVYIIHEVTDNDLIDKRAFPNPFRKNPNYLSIADLIHKIKTSSPVKIPYWMLVDLARVMEAKLAADAPFFLGNRFSHLSDLIIRNRVLPSAKLCDS